MLKRADFCIVAVKYGRARSGIVEVEVRPDQGMTLGPSRWMSRQVVVNAILVQGLTFITAYRKDGQYVRGEDVGVVEVNGSYFLRTDRNRIGADNLENLPEYEGVSR